MVTEFWEDYYAENPQEALRSGDRIVTGDPLIDKWEEEIHKGMDPDLSEGLTDDEYDKLLSWSARKSEESSYEIGNATPDFYKETF